MKVIFIDYKNSCFKIILFLTGSYEKWQIEFRPTFRSIVLSSELTWFDEHPRRYTRSCRRDKSLDGTRYFYDQFEMFVTRQEETVKSHPTGSMYFRNLEKMFARRGGENHWIPADRGYYVVTRVGKSFEIHSLSRLRTKRFSRILFENKCNNCNKIKSTLLMNSHCQLDDDFGLFIDKSLYM